MQTHLVITSRAEQKVLEYDTDKEPPQLGHVVLLPFGPNNEICPYRVIDIYFAQESQDRKIFYIEVTPA